MSDVGPPQWLPAGALGLVLLSSVARGLISRATGVQSYGFGFKPEIQQVAERFWQLAVALVASSALIAWLAPHWGPALGRPAWSYSTPQHWLASCALMVADRRALA